MGSTAFRPAHDLASPQPCAGVLSTFSVAFHIQHAAQSLVSATQITELLAHLLASCRPPRKRRRRLSRPVICLDSDDDECGKEVMVEEVGEVRLSGLLLPAAASAASAFLHAHTVHGSQMLLSLSHVCSNLARRARSCSSALLMSVSPRSHACYRHHPTVAETTPNEDSVCRGCRRTSRARCAARRRTAPTCCCASGVTWGTTRGA